MPAPADCVKIMMGDDAGKIALMDFYIQRIQSGENLEEWEGIILEALRKTLVHEEPIPMSMTSSLTGVGGVNN